MYTYVYALPCPHTSVESKGLSWRRAERLCGTTMGWCLNLSESDRWIYLYSLCSCLSSACNGAKGTVLGPTQLYLARWVHNRSSSLWLLLYY